MGQCLTVSPRAGQGGEGIQAHSHYSMTSAMGCGGDLFSEPGS